MEKICKDLSSFMDLFDDLSKLFEPPDDVTPTLLDADCKHSVLGECMQLNIRTCCMPLVVVHSTVHHMHPS